jgi:hypothetical protein
MVGFRAQHSPDIFVSDSFGVTLLSKSSPAAEMRRAAVMFEIISLIAVKHADNRG